MNSPRIIASMIIIIVQFKYAKSEADLEHSRGDIYRFYRRICSFKNIYDPIELLF